MLDVDACVDKRGGQVLGEVLQVVGHLLTRDGGEVHQVDLVDQNEIGRASVSTWQTELVMPAVLCLGEMV
ncbi:hypothetical protein [Streptomyces sp. NPDC095817]|uniref:hypothetical protein n=1 Tax=Streptomyces sp. NPDC095817 TaxID=3155082 RepID=UPI0033181781